MDAKDEIKTRLSIEEVIGEYVPLKRAGRNWKGLSPFTAERTPSFVVSPDKQIWHDFSSSKGGDMFSFVMEVEGLDFRQALELLARRAGIDLDQYRQPGSAKGQSSSKQKERLYEAAELACKFYQAQFAHSRAALEYVLQKRAFSKETALEWRLGYSPVNGAALVDFLKGKGFTVQEIRLAGLSGQRGGDMFRGRLQVPLCDPSGRVIGFTARLLADDPNAPKYINTPGTPLYDKSRHVFGLHLAKEMIRKSKFAVLAEGNLDVIQSHQAGVRQVVATAGTALTEYQLKALGRLTPDIRLCFDADRAGVQATERAIPIAAKVEVNLSVIQIPSGKDPDELIKQDVSIWERIINEQTEALDWLIEQYRRTEDLATVAGRNNFKQAVFGLVSRLESKGEQSIYADKVAHALGYPNGDAVRDELKLLEQGQKTYKSIRRTQTTGSDDDVSRKKTEDSLLALTLLQPKLRSYLYPLDPDMFAGDQAREVFEFLATHPDYDGTDKTAVQKFAEYAKILSLVYETLYQDLDALELDLEAKRVTGKLIAQYVRTEKQALTAELQQAEQAEAVHLLARVAELDQLLRTNLTKEGS